MSPKTMKALTIGSRSIFFPLSLAFGNSANQHKITQVPIPTPGPGQLLLKLDWFAANPVDVLYLDALGSAGSTLGCDFVGTITQLGQGSTRFKEGEKVVGMIHGGAYTGVGSAAEFAVVDEALCWGLPESMEPKEAVTFGTAFITAAMCLYVDHGIAQTSTQIEGEPWFLVSGGSTSVGLFAIQLARKAGYRVIATSSPSSFDLVKSYGANEVVSYKDLDKALVEIKTLTGGGVSAGLDCVGGAKNVGFAVNAFGPSGGKLSSTLVGGKSKRSEVKLSELMVFTVFGKAFTFIPIIARYSAVPDRRRWYEQFCSTAQAFIETNGIKGNPQTVRTGGLEGIPASWDDLRAKKVSGSKLVHQL